MSLAHLPALTDHVPHKSVLTRGRTLIDAVTAWTGPACKPGPLILTHACPLIVPVELCGSSQSKPWTMFPACLHLKEGAGPPGPCRARQGKAGPIHSRYLCSTGSKQSSGRQRPLLCGLKLDSCTMDWGQLGTVALSLSQGLAL